MASEYGMNRSDSGKAKWVVVVRILGDEPNPPTDGTFVDLFINQRKHQLKDEKNAHKSVMTSDDTGTVEIVVHSIKDWNRVTSGGTIRY